jgi:SpoIID/LytB domain protein
MDINKYVAGLGEIPSKACGNAQQAAARPDKYVVDNTTTIWDCWPEETIKAQVIAARSYAMHRGGTICTTAACQVYVGGTAKQWAADETHNQVIVSHGYTHNGNVIEALYSSDNNQGYGTADNDTIWSNNAGDGTAYSYLRHVNDTGTAYNYSWTNWTWRTDGFAINQIRDMLSHVNRNGSYTSSRGFVNGVLNDVGNIANISFERDGSNRVKKVVITGTNGTTRKMAGWLFKNIWNSWVANEQPHGSVDYIYSKTFFLLQQ